MPVPNLAKPSETWPYRLAVQTAMVSCYMLVAIALLYSAWRIAATSEMIDRVLSQQTAILSEIRDARRTIPEQVKEAIPDVLKGGK